VQLVSWWPAHGAACSNGHFRKYSHLDAVPGTPRAASELPGLPIALPALAVIWRLVNGLLSPPCNIIGYNCYVIYLQPSLICIIKKHASCQVLLTEQQIKFYYFIFTLILVSRHCILNKIMIFIRSCLKS
jgi:hypothetical protein